MERLLTELALEDGRADDCSRLLKKCRLYELLIFLTRCQAGEEKAADPETAGQDGIYYEAARYICAHYAQDLKLEELAARAGVTPTSFSRNFKRATGFGFKEYLVQIRIREASVKLLETNLPVTAVAVECGFNDSNYFSEAFKKLKGVSPRQYRKEPEAI